MDFAKARYNMVASQVRTWDVLNPDVLAVMAELPREEFVPTALSHFAYADMALPLGEGQVMLPPKEQGRILQAVAIQATDRVLEICTGTGYLTALCAHFAQHVVSVEIDPTLHMQAKQNLKKLGIANVELVLGDGAQGWSAHGTFDVIIITGGLPALPPAYKEILNPGGRLFVTMGQAPLMRANLIHHPAKELWHVTTLYETIVPMMQNTAPLEEFNF